VSDYRRSKEGCTFFFTVVTHERRPILTTDRGRECLRAAILETQKDRPFEITAIVLLPDHLYAVLTLSRRVAQTISFRLSGCWKHERFDRIDDGLRASRGVATQHRDAGGPDCLQSGRRSRKSFRPEMLSDSQ
jgi:hypothetical protein